MGAALELKTPWTDPSKDRPAAVWSAPTAAYDVYLPGLSPYLHYWQDLRARRGQTRPPPTHGAEDGQKIPGQMTQSLEELIRQSFGR